MKMMKKMTILLLSLIVALAMTGGYAFADSTKINGHAVFIDDGIISDFTTEEVTDAFNNLQPGDDITVRVKYQNDTKKSTDWYMANEVIQTLEKADAARKTVDGTDIAENGGYTYKLVHTNKKGKKEVLFSNEDVGGDAKPADMEGLEQATNALDDWFYLQTLKKGESGMLTLTVKFEGETEVNDYMDTNGGVMMRFAVELTKNGTPSGKPTYEQDAKTGDAFPLWIFLLMMIAGLVLLALLLKRKKDEEGGEA